MMRLQIEKGPESSYMETLITVVSGLILLAIAAIELI